MTQNWHEFIAQFPISSPTTKMLVDLSHFGVIKISGPDAAKFLQGQLTCDVLSLRSGASTLGAYCNIKGRIESLFRMWCGRDDYYLRMIANLVDPTIQELKKYAIFSKVAIQNVSDRIRGFGISDHIINLAELDADLAILEIKPQQRYEVFGPTEALKKAWLQCIADTTHVEANIWEQQDIQDQLPELYPATIAEFLPHDLNLPALNAVSFKKGCYRGQEIVARMQHRGNLKRHLQTFTKDAAVEINPGDIITIDSTTPEKTGKVVRVCKNANAIHGLVVIKD